MNSKEIPGIGNWECSLSSTPQTGSLASNQPILSSYLLCIYIKFLGNDNNIYTDLKRLREICENILSYTHHLAQILL